MLIAESLPVPVITTTTTTTIIIIIIIPNNKPDIIIRDKELATDTDVPGSIPGATRFSE